MRRDHLLLRSSATGGSRDERLASGSDGSALYAAWRYRTTGLCLNDDNRGVIGLFAIGMHNLLRQSLRRLANIQVQVLCEL